MTRVLVVENSPLVRDLLVYILGSDPEIRIVGCAGDGEEAVRLTQMRRPDVITMGLQLPRIDGYEATRRIMETCPTPIVAVGGGPDDDAAATDLKAVEAGALVIVQRPPGPGHSMHHQAASALIRTVKSMAEVKVVRRWAKSRPACVAERDPTDTQRAGAGTGLVHSARRLVLIGASTGGPAVLAEILTQLAGQGFPLPIVIVQHMSVGFAEGFADWLTKTSGFPVGMARHGEHLAGGQAYLAPDGFQVAVDRELRVILSRGKAEHGMCPSVSHLFRSVDAPLRAATVAILLTGMGRDGAYELKELKKSGAVTIVQDRLSAAVYGMPGEALKLDAAHLVLTPPEIGHALRGLAKYGAGNFSYLDMENN